MNEAALSKVGQNEAAQEEKTSPGDLAAQLQDVKIRVSESLKTVAEDVMRLANAIQILNMQGHRNTRVDALLSQVLAPTQEASKAIASLAELRAALRNVGKIVQVAAEWDSQMRFMFMFRGENGWIGPLDGFNLVDGTPGQASLREALHLLQVPDGTIAKFLAQPIVPPPANVGTVRRVLFE